MGPWNTEWWRILERQYVEQIATDRRLLDEKDAEIDRLREELRGVRAANNGLAKTALNLREQVARIEAWYADVVRYSGELTGFRRALEGTEQ